MYKELALELDGILNEYWLTNLANFGALLMQHLPRLNWVGFYLRRGEDLYLGPFQGKPACLYIPAGKGVCGAAAQTRKTMMVADVHQFPGHIACDVASRSEMVIPLLHSGRMLGVLDLDSPEIGRFSDSDRAGLEPLVELLLSRTDWPDQF